VTAEADELEVLGLRVKGLGRDDSTTAVGGAVPRSARALLGGSGRVIRKKNDRAWLQQTLTSKAAKSVAENRSEIVQAVVEQGGSGGKVSRVLLLITRNNQET